MEITEWVAASLIAKTLSDNVPLRARPGLPREFLRIALLVMLAFIAHESLFVAGAIAFIGRLVFLAGKQILTAINHMFLELIFLTVILVLRDEPHLMAAVLQPLVVSVWLFSVWQKLFHGEFADGTFFYCMFAADNLKGLRKRFIPVIQPSRDEALFHEMSSEALKACRRMALACLGIELVPVAALLVSGGIVAALLMLVIAVCIGFMSNELSFMRTNIILSGLFLVPFQFADLVTAVQEFPAIAGLVSWAAAWPVLHAIVTRHFGISSWRLFGWGMYATTLPRAIEVVPEGVIRNYVGSARLLLEGYGECRISYFRRLILGAVQGETVQGENTYRSISKRIAFGTLKPLKSGNILATSVTLVETESEPTTFVVDSAERKAELDRYLKKLWTSSRKRAAAHTA